MPKSSLMTKEQVKYHMDAWRFAFLLREQCCESWDFDAIRRDLAKLEEQYGAAYSTAGR